MTPERIKELRGNALCMNGTYRTEEIAPLLHECLDEIERLQEALNTVRLATIEFCETVGMDPTKFPGLFDPAESSWKSGKGLHPDDF